MKKKKSKIERRLLDKGFYLRRDELCALAGYFSTVHNRHKDKIKNELLALRAKSKGCTITDAELDKAIDWTLIKIERAMMKNNMETLGPTDNF